MPTFRSVNADIKIGFSSLKGHMVNFVNEDLISYYYLDLAQIVG